MVKKASPQRHDKRLKILGEDELHVLYGRPEFTAEERGLYFLLSSAEQFHLNELGDVASRLHFILQLGYFKAQHQFHTFTVHDVSEDATYICNLYFPDTQLPEHFKISRRRRLRHQALILELCHYRYCNQAVRQQLVVTAQQRAKIFSQPLYIFRELLQYLAEHHYIAPGYSFFQETIGRVLHQEQQRLSQIVRHELSHSDSQALLSLITETDAMYGITRLKQMPKDFSQGQIKGEIQRAVAMKPLYASAQKVLPRLDISNESIKYYASLVDYYSVFRLTQLDPLIVQVYLLCFVLYRYCKLHDHLITALIHHVKGYLDEAKQAAKDRVYDSRLEQNRNLAKAGQLLKLFTDPIAPQTPFETVQAQAFMILERPQLDRLATYLSFHAQFDEVAFQWEYIDQISRRFKRQLRPLLRHVEWMAWSGQQPFLWAVHCLKQIFEKKRSLTSAPWKISPLISFLIASNSISIQHPRKPQKSCWRIATSFLSIVFCVMALKRVIFSVATVCATAALRMI